MTEEKRTVYEVCAKVKRRYGTLVELNLQAVFDTNGSNANRANIITGPVLMQKHKL